MVTQLLDKFIYRVLFSILSGLLLCISFPEIGSFYPLSFIALVPLLLLEEKLSDSKKSFGLFFHSYLTFFIYNVGTTYWIYYADADGAFMAFFANTLVMSIAFLLFHLLKRRLGRAWRIPLLLSTWLSFEYMHFNWELSWPWLTLGNVFANQPEIVQWYSITGVLGGSLWILLINGIITQLFLTGFELQWYVSKRFWTLILLFLFPIITSLIKYSITSEAGQEFGVGVIQPNFDPYQTKFVKSDEEQLEEIFSLADAAVTSNTKFIAAPETALNPNGLIDEDRLANTVIYHQIMERRAKWNNADFLIGASSYRIFEEKTRFTQHFNPNCNCFIENYNTSILFSHKRTPDFVHKSKLVLGVEKIPFSTVFPQLENMAIQLGGTSGTLGIEGEGKVLKTGNTCFSPIVCYESIYGGFMAKQAKNGAEFIAIITNDGWWRDTPGYKQHFAFARLRAIENNKFVVRSANTGKSGIISNRGDVLKETKWNEKTSFSFTIHLNKTTTFYQILGDFIGFFAVVSLVILILMRFYKGFRFGAKNKL